MEQPESREIDTMRKMLKSKMLHIAIESLKNSDDQWRKKVDDCLRGGVSVPVTLLLKKGDLFLRNGYLEEGETAYELAQRTPKSGLYLSCAKAAAERGLYKEMMTAYERAKVQPQHEVLLRFVEIQMSKVRGLPDFDGFFDYQKIISVLRTANGDKKIALEIGDFLAQHAYFVWHVETAVEALIYAEAYDKLVTFAEKLKKGASSASYIVHVLRAYQGAKRQDLAEPLLQTCLQHGSTKLVTTLFQKGMITSAMLKEKANEAFFRGNYVLGMRWYENLDDEPSESVLQACAAQLAGKTSLSSSDLDFLVYAGCSSPLLNYVRKHLEIGDGNDDFYSSALSALESIA